MKDKRPKKKVRTAQVQIPTANWDKTLDLHDEGEPLWGPVSKHHQWLWPMVIALVFLGMVTGWKPLPYAATILALVGVGLIYKEMS